MVSHILNCNDTIPYLQVLEKFMSSIPENSNYQQQVSKTEYGLSTVLEKVTLILYIEF